MSVSAPQASDDGLPPHFDGNRPPRGGNCKFFPSYPYCDKKKYPANKCWTQFGKPPTTQVVVTPSATLSPALHDTPTDVS